MNSSAGVVGDVPSGPVTVTSTVPVPGGEVAVICESESTVMDTAAVPPNWTSVAPVKPLPSIVTVVPPASGPLAGLMPVTAGAATSWMRKKNGSMDASMFLSPSAPSSVNGADVV